MIGKVLLALAVIPLVSAWYGLITGWTPSLHSVSVTASFAMALAAVAASREFR